ncbi:disease resistance protein Pik-1-like [Populus alba x Populus x berolinensis]|uniref:Disease resistance protein Pik-1-like n=1 Tax=Populus alba x Populus x berolinensis TaxID=444605 RepID=A0AAD6QK13_9ROSI|nr:disease resistance protein Pik-1-like [Populus alba x Populus x berolinensis]KAJ6991828.1 disease resistance protein Pik-1-like [Populus alba x Populus x berolinensis]
MHGNGMEDLSELRYPSGKMTSLHMQVIVFKVQMACGKSRVKARTVVAKACGVNALALQGDDRIVVSGDGIDAAHLTYCLRKKVGHTDIISIMLVHQ